MMQQKTRQIKIAIVAISLLIHGFFAFFLMIPELHHPFTKPLTLFTDDLPLQAEALNQEQPNSPNDQQKNTPEETQKQPREEFEWAEMKMGAGTFGAPVEFVELAEVPEYGDPNGQETTSDSAEQVEEQTSHAPMPKIIQEETPTIAPGKGTTFLVPQEQKTIENPTNQTHSYVQKKKKRGTTKGVTLAHLAQGYLDSLSEGGSYSIGMAGNPNKLPTQEQLQLENFSGKLIWQVQNIHHINFERFNLPPMESSIHIYFMLDHKGKMSNLKILQSSGNHKVDDYILYLFKEASGSFPPLPSFIKQDPAPLDYNLSIYFAPESPIRVHRSFS